MGDDMLDLEELLKTDPWSKGPTMAEMNQWLREEERRARLERRSALHARSDEICDRIMLLTRVQSTLRDDDLELDFIPFEAAGLSLSLVRSELISELAGLRAELAEIRRDPDYQAA